MKAWKLLQAPQPTIRNKPNTTHAPLRTSSPKPSQLEATCSAQRPSKQPKAKTTPECTERCENQVNISNHASFLADVSTYKEQVAKHATCNNPCRKKKQGSSSLATAREAVRHTRQHGLLMRWQRDRVESLTRHEKQIPSSKHISKINKTGRMGCPQAGARSAQVPKHAVTARAANHDRLDGISTGISTARALAAAPIRTVLFIFPSRYLFAIGLTPVFSLGRNLPPYWGCIPKQPDSQTAPRGATGSGHDGALTLSGAPFQGTWARSVAEDASPDYNSDSVAARFSSWAVPGSLAVTKGILVSFFSSAY
ncbi:hypothetical protein Tco_0691064 [Tanacetum coccineum]